MEQTLLLKIVAGVAAFIGAPLSLIVVYLINGIGFGCWGDPTAAAVACKMELPNTVSAAITAILTGSITVVSQVIAGYLSPATKQGG